MKKNFYLTIIGIVSIGLLFSYSGGSPGGRTNSPGDGGSNCANCHSSTITTASWISTNIPASGYVPGETYTITASGSEAGAAKFGFEVTAEVAGTKVGSFVITDDTETKFTNSSQAVTHTSSGNTTVDGAKTWTFDWVAPESGTGEITFYGAFNAADGNGSSTGDAIYTSVLAIPEQISGIDKNDIAEIKISPNPTSDFILINSNETIKGLRITDFNGKVVFITSKLNTKVKSINLSNFSKGVYIVDIKTSNSIISKKIIVQ